MQWYSAISLDQCLAQPFSKKVPPSGNEWKYREPRLGNVQRVRDLGTLSIKWNISIKYLLPGVREPRRGECGEIVKARVDGEHQGNKVY